MEPCSRIAAAVHSLYALPMSLPILMPVSQLRVAAVAGGAANHASTNMITPLTASACRLGLRRLFRGCNLHIAACALSCVADTLLYAFELIQLQAF